ncbi:hypothetical protein IFM89_023676 [Coptis chinensis]|uniref:Uncharacterized protein n=1 Tax=Coptis chinensis TaxID=261450 RepID=A0A835GXN7_9MAGN|nr:hypothetical protein IFM89_023676 [Coptis chinensis]
MFLWICNQLLRGTQSRCNIPQAANCISRMAERANTPVIYLSTDAAESETDLLQSLTMLNGRTIPLVKQPSQNSAENGMLCYTYMVVLREIPRLDIHRGHTPTPKRLVYKFTRDKLERHLADAYMFDMAWMVTHNGGAAIKYDTKFVCRG